MLRFRYRLTNIFSFFRVICAVLAWRWPVLGYATPIMAIGINLFLRRVGDDIKRLVPAAPGRESPTLMH